ncbi:MAG: STN domain-containing protein [Planctomycetota bacterium]
MKSVATFLSVILIVFSGSMSSARCEEANDRLKKALSRKVTFDFADAPFVETMEFVRRLSNATIVVSPQALEDAKKTTITLRVADMEMENALQWILKLADLEYKIQEDAIYIVSHEQKKGQEKNGKKEKDPDADAAGLLRVKFASGDTIEVDSAMMKRNPFLATEMLAMAFDPAKDGILVLVPGRDIPPQLDVRDFVQSAVKIAPDVKPDFDERLKLLTFRAKDDMDLRRINAMARALRRSPMFGPPPNAKNNDMQMRFDPNQKISLKATDQTLKLVMNELGAMLKVTILAGDKEAGKRFAEPVSVDINDVDPKQSLGMMSQLTGLRFEVQGNTIMFYSGVPNYKGGPMKPPFPPDDPDMKGKKKKTDVDLQF